MKTIHMHERQSLIRFETTDHLVLSGLLVTRDYEQEEDILDVPILLEIHGLLGHFLARGTPRLLPHALLERGFNSLSINTRLAYAGQINGQGIFDDVMFDLDAAVEFLTNEGFRNIFALGYSLGASMLAYWTANRIHTNLKGLILEGIHYSLPDSKRRQCAKYGSDPTYDELYERAKGALGDDPYHSENDETIVIYQAKGPNREPLNNEIYTYKTWWYMIGPEAYNAMSYKLIDRISLPMLMIRGAFDHLVESGEAEKLAGIARNAGNNNIRVKEIPNADHDCMENADIMLDEICGMFERYSDPYPPPDTT